MGLCFGIAPSGRDVLLIEAGTPEHARAEPQPSDITQAQDRLSNEDLEGRTWDLPQALPLCPQMIVSSVSSGTMYFNASGGMRPGHIAKLEPVAQNGMEENLVADDALDRTFDCTLEGVPA